MSLVNLSKVQRPSCKCVSWSMTSSATVASFKESNGVSKSSVTVPNTGGACYCLGLCRASRTGDTDFRIIEKHQNRIGDSCLIADCDIFVNPCWVIATGFGHNNEQILGRTKNFSQRSVCGIENMIRSYHHCCYSCCNIASNLHCSTTVKVII